MNSAMIYGTGKESVKIKDGLKDTINFKGFIVSDEKDQGTNIFAIENINLMEVDYIIIGSVSFEKEMVNKLIANGFEAHKILTPLKFKSGYNRVLFKEHIDLTNQYNTIFENEYVDKLFDNLFPVSINKELAENRIINPYHYKDYNFDGVDFVRVSTFELLVREIKEKKIKGSVAEVGVYQGHTSLLLSHLFSERKLYLFDTFEGFHESDVNFERDNSYAKTTVGHFSSTSIDLVKEKLKHHSQLEIRKGYFPQTATNINDTFAFVSLDADLFQPTYEGLKYFYEKLNKGGYIVVHDYNFKGYPGAKAAVQQFCKEESIPYIPVSDYYGSVIIAK
ncbi:TylF/MycF/NovP-related O-methyltransferase [Lysinibacillus sp. FSL M8-0134]|uniref:TylF/MycF/NovP-related O-methyltransferase n=1 Tax=Lysinibacillus sp. FSL M8-0134 TaxID=2921717 RepID=UPI00311910B3